MTAIIVDTNVILDILTEDASWFAWSSERLAHASGRLIINPIIYAEISVHFKRIEEVDEVLERFAREPIPFTAAFLAGKAYVQYRRQGGVRRAPLPDFFIGAHAAVAGYQLLTRDPLRFHSYFPTLALIAPWQPRLDIGLRPPKHKSTPA